MTVVAEAMLALGNVGAAEPLLQQVVVRSPSFAPATMLLAQLRVAELRLKEAADILQASAARLPRDLNVRRYLADVLTQMNDPARALRSMRRYWRSSRIARPINSNMHRFTLCGAES